MESKSASINGTNMRWVEQGEGLPVVLIHGIPTSPVLWRHVFPLMDGVRCLAPEMVGYGESIAEGKGRDISVSQQAEYLIAWLDHLGIDKAIFAGHDLGGGVAQIAAVRHPQRCLGLFLTNAIGYDSWPIPSIKALQMAAPLVKHLPDTAGRQILATLMYRGHDDAALARESLDLHWQPYARHEGPASLVMQVEALNVQDTIAVSEELANLQIPARVVWGTDDKFQKLEFGERFARDLNAPLRTINGGLHFTPEDHPKEIAEELHLLVESVRKRLDIDQDL